jgi:uncharacterized membrane protein YoaK (UPF0700 family)
VASFFLGAVVSTILTESARRRGAASKYVLPVALEAALLSRLAVLLQATGHVDWRVASAGGAGAGTLYAITGIGALAMGLQNATVTRVSGAVVRTTHLTGVTTDLGIELVQALYWYHDKLRGRGSRCNNNSGSGVVVRTARMLRVSRRHPSVMRLALLGSIFGSFLLGAVLGTVAYALAPRLALLAPVLFLAWIILVDYWTPIADVRELDLAADTELASLGVVKALLPPALGIYRLSHHRKDRVHHVPDFLHWADRLPRHWRVVILAVGRLTRLDDEGAMGLREAALRLSGQGRRLIVCGVTPAQFKVLARGGVTNVLEPEDVCPDLEFAIARGILLVETAEAAKAA